MSNVDKLSKPVNKASLFSLYDRWFKTDLEGNLYELNELTKEWELKEQAIPAQSG